MSNFRNHLRPYHRPSASVPVNLSPLSVSSIASSLSTFEEGSSPSSSGYATPSYTEEDSDTETRDDHHHSRSATTASGTGGDDDAEDDDDGIEWGHPLQRMVSLRPNREAAFTLLSSTFASSTFPAPESQQQTRRGDSNTVHYLTFDEEYASSEEDEDETGFNVLAEDSEDDDTGSETSSVDWNAMDFEQVIDELIASPTFQIPSVPIGGAPGTGHTVYTYPFAGISSSLNSPVRSRRPSFAAPPPELPVAPCSDSDFKLHIIPFHASSPALYLILHFNQPDVRADPWNPVPRVVGVSERQLPRSPIHRENTVKDAEEEEESENFVFLLMPYLSRYDEPPMKNVANWVDFLRQGLEGLTFLHEHDLVRISPSPSPTSNKLPFFADTSSSPSSSPSSSTNEFDRTLYPVKYYFDVRMFSSCLYPPYISSLLPPPPLFSTVQPESRQQEQKVDAGQAKVEDMQGWGQMVEDVIQDIPVLKKKLAPLVQSMRSGGFSAENARKLFEALCWGLPS